jgi:outer membrane receptor protein involved in Fe transport
LPARCGKFSGPHLPHEALSALTAAVSRVRRHLTFAAQTAPKPDPNDDETVTLTAFTVNASTDVGYMATNTLAGTRLNTPLRDVGTAVSVVTKEFLTDVDANDSSTLLTYTVSTEVGGIDGNYAGGNFGVSRPDQNGARARARA